MTTTFECPSCGAPLQPDGARTTRTCPYCHESVIIPESLRDRPPIVQQTVIYTPANYTPAPPRVATRPRHGSRCGCVLGLLGFVMLLTIATSGLAYFVDRPTRSELATIPAYTTPISLDVSALETSVAATFVPSASRTPSFAIVEQTFGSAGTGPGHFDDARGLALDGDGHVYVGEYSSGRVQRFDLNGKFLNSWIVAGESALVGLTADRMGNVYAVRDGTLLKYRGSDGTLLAHNAADVFGQTVALPDGGLLAWSEGGDAGFLRLNAQGSVTDRIPDPLQAQTDSNGGPAHFAVDGQGTIYAINVFNDGVFQFTASGKFVNKFAPQGDEPGQLGSAEALAVDNQSRVYVSDTRGIQVFDHDGRYLATIAQNDYIPALVFDDQNALWLIARNTGEIRKLVLTQPATP